MQIQTGLVVGLAVLGSLTPAVVARVSTTELYDALAGRRAKTNGVQLSGFEVSGDSTSSAGAALLGALQSIVDAPSSDRLSIAKQAAMANIDHREAWNFVLRQRRGVRLREDRVRDLEVDEMGSSLSSVAPPDAALLPVVVREVRDAEPNFQQLLRNGILLQLGIGDVVERSAEGFDPSLRDWADYVGRLGAEHVAMSEVDGLVVLQSQHTNGAVGRFTFDPAHSWRLVSAETWVAGSLAYVEYYAYGALGAEAEFPVAALRRRIGSGTSDAVSLAILQWQMLELSDEVPSLRAPPLRFEAVSGMGPNGGPGLVYPPGWETLTSAERLASAMQGILSAWGTSSAAWDFDADGEIGPGDLAWISAVIVGMDD